MTINLLKVTTLCPLFIGDGEELRLGFDFITHQNRTFRLDVDALLSARQDQLKPDRSGQYPLPAKLLLENDLKNSTFFRYEMSGIPRSGRADARLKSHIKDIHDRPYIPGSSLKGAVRTALAWTAWDEVKPQLNRSAIGRSRSWAGQPLENKIFGADPNHDLLRALQVSDCRLHDDASDRMHVVNAQVLTQRSAASPVALEAVCGDTVFGGSIKIDDTLFSAQAERLLHFASRRHWLDELLPRIQAHSMVRIKMLADWFEKAANCAAVARFYRHLAQVKLPASQALLQLGWGTGWDGVTFFTHLQQDIHLFEQLVREFNMHKSSRGSPPRRPGDAFPRSRRAAMSEKKGVAVPAAPFGWVLLEVSSK